MIFLVVANYGAVFTDRTLMTSIASLKPAFNCVHYNRCGGVKLCKVIRGEVLIAYNEHIVLTVVWLMMWLITGGQVNSHIYPASCVHSCIHTHAECHSYTFALQAYEYGLPSTTRAYTLMYYMYFYQMHAYVYRILLNTRVYTHTYTDIY